MGRDISKEVSEEGENRLLKLPKCEITPSRKVALNPEPRKASNLLNLSLCKIQ